MPQHLGQKCLWNYKAKFVSLFAIFFNPVLVNIAETAGSVCLNKRDYFMQKVTYITDDLFRMLGYYGTKAIKDLLFCRWLGQQGDMVASLVVRAITINSSRDFDSGSLGSPHLFLIHLPFDVGTRFSPSLGLQYLQQNSLLSPESSF
ncbi:hypothetical protein CEXT_419891 [Caerostris extrusa]|uniref:Uncharacterized protein n=1 Tax=Caerostris extrusa TaxID=172846 RepID=A0AAV4SJZ4_CAEEX|nr:hypothetical protein CEXT_419891 [Caerostris extrusa]